MYVLIYANRLTGRKKFCKMGSQINFRLSKPADEKVTATFAVETQTGDLELLLSEVKLDISQRHGLVEKESWVAAIHLALGHMGESSQSCSRSRKCLLKMQLVRHDPPDQSDWDDLWIYEHAEDDCPYCDLPTTEEASISGYVNLP